MNREIKFRGKRVDNGEWVYGYIIKLDHPEHKDKIYIIPSFASAIYYYEVISETVGQYTGLKDKNGKEIYEGDMIHALGGECYHGTWEYDYKIAIKNFMADIYDIAMASMSSDIEVIGNSIDNKELLGE